MKIAEDNVVNVYYIINNGELVKSTNEEIHKNDPPLNKTITNNCDICLEKVFSIKYMCSDCLECFCCKIHKKNHDRIYHNKSETIKNLKPNAEKLYKFLNFYNEDLIRVYIQIIDYIKDANHAVDIIVDLCKICSTITDSDTKIYLNTIIDYILWIIKNLYNSNQHKILYRSIKHKKKFIINKLEEYDSIRFYI